MVAPGEEEVPLAARLTIAAMSAAVVLVTAGCAPSRPDPFEIGIKRMTLELAFADEDKASPPDPARVIEVIGLPEEILDQPLTPPATRPSRTSDGVALPRCPVAGPNVFPKEPVTLVMRGAPREGLYTLHNSGTIKINAGGVALPPLPYPIFSTLEIRKVVVTPEVPADSPIPEDIRDQLGGGNIVTFEATRKVGTTTIVDQYRYDDTKFELLQRERFIGAKRTLFRATPPITMQELGRGNGDDWVSGGVDRETQLAMVVNGVIGNNEAVDVCGKKYDTLPVSLSEQLVNVATGDTLTTDAQAPNVYRFANHYGGLIIQEDAHFTETVTVEGSPVTVEYDYVSTFDSIDPVAP